MEEDLRWNQERCHERVSGRKAAGNVSVLLPHGRRCGRSACPFDSLQYEINALELMIVPEFFISQVLFPFTGFSADRIWSGFDSDQSKEHVRPEHR